MTEKTMQYLREKDLFYLPFFFLFALTPYLAGYPGLIFIDGDTPWHLAAGDYIRAHGVPASDPWGIMSGTQPWYNISWLYDMAISWMAGGIGVEGLAIVTACLGALLASLVLWTCAREGAGFLVILPMSLLVLMACKPVVNARPALLSFLLLFACYRALAAARDERCRAYVWFLPLIAALWVNIHGGFIALIPVIGAFGVEALLKGEWRHAVRLAGVGLTCLSATLINPYGIDIYQGVLATMSGTLEVNYIDEWLPPTLKKSPPTYGYVLAMMVFALPLRRQKLADTLLAWFWAVMAMQSFRYIPVLAIFASPPLARAVESFFRASAWREAYMRKSEEYGRAFAGKVSAIICGSLTVIALSALSVPALRTQVWGRPLMDEAHYPVQEIAFLKERYDGKRLLNYYDYGGFVIYLTQGSIPHLVDGRAGTAHSPDVLKDYLAIERLDADWQQIVEKYGIETLLLPNRMQGLYHVEQSGWEKVFQGAVASVYAKQKPAAN